MSLNISYDLQSYKTESNPILTPQSLTCWNCHFSFSCSGSEPVTLCPNCNKYNRVPRGQRGNITNFSENLNSNNYNSINDNINSRDKILICPYCYTKNLFESDADELICYKCSRKIRSNNNDDVPEILTDRDSYDKKIMGWKLVPTPAPPILSNYELPLGTMPNVNNNSNTEYLLKKILKSIKKQNSKESNVTPYPMYNPPFVPYPVFDYFSNRKSFGYRGDYDEDKISNIRTREIRYVPIRNEIEKEKNEGYKITIRKKNRRNGLAKSTVFEKVFYLNK